MEDEGAPSQRSGLPPLTNISKPEEYDVLSGRGVSTNRHPGNIRFRSLVGLNKELYVTSSKRQKMAISRSIVDAVRSANPPGRFLEKNPETCKWSDIGDRKAIEKTSQALRDGAASLRKQLSADLGDPDFLGSVFDEKSKGKDKKVANKQQLSKTKTVKKAHRRSKSNPDSLSMANLQNYKKPHVRKRKPTTEHPLSPSGSSRRTSVPSSLPTSPTGDQVIRTARTFDGDCRYLESPRSASETYTPTPPGHPFFERSPSFEGWGSPSAPSLPPRDKWGTPSRPSHSQGFLPGRPYPPPPHMHHPMDHSPMMNHSPMNHSPMSYASRSFQYSGHQQSPVYRGTPGQRLPAGPWRNYNGSHPPSPSWSADGQDMSVPDLQRCDSHPQGKIVSPIAPRSCSNPYYDPRVIRHASSAEDFLPPASPCTVQRRCRPATKEITPSIPLVPKDEKSCDDAKRQTGSPAGTSATETESTFEDDNPQDPLGVNSNDSEDGSTPRLPTEVGSSVYAKPELQVSEGFVEAFMPSSTPSESAITSCGDFDNHDSFLIEERSLSPLPFENDTEDDWMDITGDLFQIMPCGTTANCGGPVTAST